MNKVNELAVKLVSSYQGSSQTAGLPLRGGEGRAVRGSSQWRTASAVNFKLKSTGPAFGAQSPAVAAEFASDLGIAAMVAALANATMVEAAR